MPYLKTVASLALFALSGCQCQIDETNLNGIPDAGVVEEIPEEIPIFPLKAGDTLVYRGLGGRTKECNGGGGASGECQRALNATFVVQDTSFSDSNDRWTVVANAAYEGVDDTITAASLAPLVLENGVPFGQVTTGTPSTAEDAPFKTDVSPTNDEVFNELGFPFFQGGAVEVFEPAGISFCERYLELDDQANCESQFGAHKMEVFYKDEQAGAGAALHKVLVEYSQFGFVCGWDEGLIPFISDEATPREQGSFGGAGGGTIVTPDIAAQFTGAPLLTREGVQYRCQCLSQECRSDDNNCLDPADPDAEPAPCE